MWVQKLCIKSKKNTEGRDSSFGIANSYGIEGPGIESRWRGGRDFPHPSRPDLRLIEPAVKWVSSIFSGGKTAGCGVDHLFLM